MFKLFKRKSTYHIITQGRKTTITRKKSENYCKYYKTKWEAEKHRRSGQRIYRDPMNGWYLKQPSRKKKGDLSFEE